MEAIPEDTELLATKVMDAAFEVHRALGPGLLESVYEKCLCHELGKLGIAYESQVCLPIKYDKIQIESGLRLDVLVNSQIVIELKTVEAILPIHIAQLHTYLKLTECRLGFIFNFNTRLLKEGIKRIVH